MGDGDRGNLDLLLPVNDPLGAGVLASENSSGTAGDSNIGGNDSASDNAEDAPEFRTYKDDSALRDQQSTGRKRAAKMYPLNAESPCEWRLLKSCGGGKYPITGCEMGIQQARHHGPEKNTLNNEKGNVHRICHTCHNRWHTLNDEGYVWDGIHEPHSPERALLTDIVLSEQFWQGRKIVKAKD